ncbi:GH18309 [Drosophila grimshawi]|uniref:GH18309 n=2 Tax=Drosophila grimshawi TaxID=7222 RepID=B4JF93_DROGR|nr:GH18309 [Drosophila grimshawi]
MICLCAADVAHINHAAPKDVLVPFNDLLPPPLEELSSTTEAPTSATKPTIKSNLQQPQATAKKTDILAKKPGSKPELALDLLPPFAEPVSNDVADTSIGTTTATPIIYSTTTTTTTTKRPLVRYTPVATTARSVSRVAQSQQLHARPNNVVSKASASSRFSAELIRQYATYFQSTTPHPPRGPLPTLTPFPRYIKK